MRIDLVGRITVINELQSYLSYKSSGIEWIGDVPVHWAVAALKKHYAIQLGKMLQNGPNNPDDVEVPYLKAQHVQWFHVRTTDAPKMWASQDDAERFGIAPGDLLVCEGGEGGRCGIFRAKIGGYIIQNALHRVRPREQSRNDFLQYVMSAIAETGWFDALNDKATIAHFTRGKFGALRVPFPPLSEQAAIVRYLDLIDQDINRYVNAKERLIRLLEEQKQAIITRSVIRGLDPNVPLKPSRVEWIGDIPEHWQVAALRHRYSQCLGKMLDTKRITGSHLVPYLRNTDIQWDRINIDGLPTMDISPGEYDRYTVKHGDLLVCEGGEVGRCAIWSNQLTRCGFQKALHRLRPLNAMRDVVRFMYYALRVASKSQAFNDGQLSTIAHLTGEKLRTNRFPFPTFREQTAIVEFLDRTTAQIENTIAITRRQIKLLQEYRTRLIADVVTGKLDVRQTGNTLVNATDAIGRASRGVNE